MKRIIFTELMKNLKDKPHLLKKLKIFAVVGVFAFLLVGTLTVYLGVVGIRYVASVGKEINLTEQTEVLKEKVKDLPAITATNCVSTVTGLMALGPLLEKPISENYQTIKNACFKGTDLPEPAKDKESVHI